MVLARSAQCCEVLVGVSDAAVWAKVERDTYLYLECWENLGKRVNAVIEDDALVSVKGVGT